MMWKYVSIHFRKFGLNSRNFKKWENERRWMSMGVLEFVLWILHIIFSIITIGTMVAVACTYCIHMNWFEEWVDKNEIPKFIENLVVFIGIISPFISFVTGMILKEIVAS